MARKLPRFLSPEEVEAMFAASAGNKRDSMLLKCLFYLGLRNSELKNLKTDDIDMINRTVKVIKGKGKKDRYVPIPSAFLEEVREWLKSKNGRVFDISDRHIRRIVKQYAMAAGIRKAEEIHPHTLRHSYATFLQNRGVPLNTIQELLGHSRIETTTIYLHLGLERIKEQVERAFGDKKL